MRKSHLSGEKNVSWTRVTVKVCHPIGVIPAGSPVLCEGENPFASRSDDDCIFLCPVCRV